jgi:sugar/nucleoside kinase (ribokinase family)
MHILVVGTAVVNLFLDINPDHVKNENGTVAFTLGDKIPSSIKKTAIGGNGANVSVGLTRLEIPVTFYTYLADDFFSREIRTGLSSEGVELDIELHKESVPPLHIVLDFPQDRVILANYSDNPHGFSPAAGQFDFIYLTSIPNYWESAYRKILEFAKKNQIPIAFSPGTRQIENTNDLVIETVKNSKVYFSNKEEAMKIVGSKLEIANREDVKKLLFDVKKMGPEVVSITDGPQGAYAIDQEDNCFYIKAAETSEKPEKTGAGDAYAAGFFASYLYKNSVSVCMKWGNAVSGSVMKHVGAQVGLLTKKGLDAELRNINNLEAQPI